MPKGDARGYRSWRVSRRISAQKAEADWPRKEKSATRWYADTYFQVTADAIDARR